MHPLIKEHYDKARIEFTSGRYYDTMIEAKQEYFELTGILHEDEEDYEMKMNSFNDWYMLRYVSKDGGPFMKVYIENNNLGEEFYNAFIRSNYSLFEYLDKSFRGFHVFRDILHATKLSLPKDHRQLSMIKYDLVIGRILEYQKCYYFLDGMTFIPKEVKPILAKEAKRLRKMVDPNQEYEFLIKVEKMKTVYSRFGHVEPSQFFKF